MPDPTMTPFTTVFRASEPRRVKRNRQAVSCTACQRRKSRCDRRQPCGACESRGDEGTCQFVPAGSVAGNRQEVHNRLQKLEEMVRKLAESPGTGPTGTGPTGTSSSSPLPTRTPHQNDMDIDSADHHHGREGSEMDGGLSYHGPTSWAALVESIQDIQSALEDEGDGDGPLSNHPSEPDPDVVFGDLAPVTTDDIMRALPARQETDRLVSAYFNAKYIAFPFLHVHHFRRRYEAFWQNPAAAGFLWISTLFSILCGGASVCRARDKHAYAEPGPFMNMSARCLVAGRFLEGKAWSVEALATHIHVRSFRKTDADAAIWSLYALVVRQAQRQGYHRKADKVSFKLSPFDAEMRRRVWLIIQSYDIVLSHQHGMPPMIHEDSYDTEPPTNATDEDFDEDSVTIIARPPTDPLPILAYAVKSKMLPILRRSMAFNLGIKTSSWEEIKETGRELEAWYASIPPCLRYRPVLKSSFTDPNYTIMHRAMLEMMYNIVTCSLYRPFMLSAMRLGSGCEHAPALEHCRRAALRLVEIHMELDAATQPGGRLHEEKYMVSSLALHDFLVAAMILCIELLENRDMSSTAKAERVSLLRTAHDMWQSRASESHDALHATKVLRAILNKVEEPPGPVASTANGGSQCPLSRGLNGISPFEGGSYVCRNVEECAQVPAISQTLVDQAVNFDELPALDRLFTSEAMLDWSRFNCPVLFSDTEQPRIASMSFEE